MSSNILKDDHTALYTFSKTCSIFPFKWSILFITILVIATIRLGDIPRYGVSIDLDKLSLMYLAVPNLFIAFASFMTLPVAPLLTIHLTLNKRETKHVLYLPISIYTIGITKFLASKHYFPEQFLRYFN